MVASHRVPKITRGDPPFGLGVVTLILSDLAINQLNIFVIIDTIISHKVTGILNMIYDSD